MNSTKPMDASIHRLWNFVLVMFVLVFISCSEQGKQQLADPPSWQGITLGETTSEELTNLLGEPYQIELDIETNSEWYKYPNHLGYTTSPHWIEINQSCNCVVRIRETGIEDITLEDMFEQYGSPEVVVGSTTWLNSATFVNATKGIAYIAALQSAEGAHVWEIMYFEPMIVDEWLQTSWGIHLSREPQPLWENYAYEP